MRRVQKANNVILWLTDVKNMYPSDSRSSLVIYRQFIHSFLESSLKPQCLISKPGEAAGNSAAVPEQALQY